MIISHSHAATHLISPKSLPHNHTRIIKNAGTESKSENFHTNMKKGRFVKAGLMWGKQKMNDPLSTRQECPTTKIADSARLAKQNKRASQRPGGAINLRAIGMIISNNHAATHVIPPQSLPHNHNRITKSAGCLRHCPLEASISAGTDSKY